MTEIRKLKKRDWSRVFIGDYFICFNNKTFNTCSNQTVDFFAHNLELDQQPFEFKTNYNECEDDDAWKIDKLMNLNSTLNMVA